MNIKQAKLQIKNAMSAYLARDEYENRLVPIYRQRPVFLLGAPGIGKTAIMRQIADELDIGLVSYSMTHHTRQSALGLPFIVKKNYGGVEYDVSEYTMSEIIASVYDQIEATGRKEGILFLDEINCVSETLTPAMLQFLQFKEFGRHRVPDGWIVVTAGNPPEYNQSVREFDIVTWDRIKRIDVEPDFATWKEYAYATGVHACVLTYLELKPGDFYKVETGVEGKRFVTPRGWDDLSQMMLVYEKQDIEIDDLLIGQYLQDKKIAKDFTIYYSLFQKYRQTYSVETILAGEASSQLKAAMQEAPFDERISIIGMLINRVNDAMRETMQSDAKVKLIHSLVADNKESLSGSSEEAMAKLEVLRNAEKDSLTLGNKLGFLTGERRKELSHAIAFLKKCRDEIAESKQSNESFSVIERNFSNEVALLERKATLTSEELNNLFSFLEEAFGQGQEVNLVVTELSVSPYGFGFISEYGCDKYFEHNQALLFHDRHKELEEKLEQLKRV